MADAHPCCEVQVRMCMEALGRFEYHIISGQTGSGKGKLLDALRAQGAQVCCPGGPVPCSCLPLQHAAASLRCAAPARHAACSTFMPSIAALQWLPLQPAY